MSCVLQLAIGKAAEISDLLRRLEDVNGRLSSCISGVSDPRAQMLTRHRGVLQDYSQVAKTALANVLWLSSRDVSWCFLLCFL